MLALLTSIEFCIARRAKSFGLSTNLPMKLLGLLAIADDDQPALHGRAVLRFVGLLQLLVADDELVGRALAQGERRPEDIALVLLGVDAALASPAFAAIVPCRF